MTLKIFWSDDRPEQIAIWRDELIEMKHKVDEFQRIAQAVKKATTEEYDLYLIDVLQPMGRRLIPELSIHLSHLNLGPRTERGGLALARYIKTAKPESKIVIVTNQKEHTNQLIKEMPTIQCRGKSTSDLTVEQIIEIASEET